MFLQSQFFILKFRNNFNLMEKLKECNTKNAVYCFTRFTSCCWLLSHLCLPLLSFSVFFYLPIYLSSIYLNTHNFFPNFLRVSCTYHGPLPLNISYVFPKNKDILLHNFSTVIDASKVYLIEYFQQVEVPHFSFFCSSNNISFIAFFPFQYIIYLGSLLYLVVTSL